MWLPHPFPADFPRRARRGDGPADNEVSGAGPLGDAAADACGGGGTDAGGGRELHERDPEPGHGRRDGPDARRRRPRRRRRRRQGDTHTHTRKHTRTDARTRIRAHTPNDARAHTRTYTYTYTDTDTDTHTRAHTPALPTWSSAPARRHRQGPQAAERSNTRQPATQTRARACEYAHARIIIVDCQ